MNVYTSVVLLYRLLLVAVRRSWVFIFGVMLALAGAPAARGAVTLAGGDLLIADAGTSASTSSITKMSTQTSTNGDRAYVTGNGVGSGAAIDTPIFPICSPAGVVYYYESAGTNARKIISVDNQGLRTIVSSGVTGALVGSGPAFITLGGLVWDPSTSTILAVEIGTTASNCGIIRIDPTTGNLTSGNRTFLTGSGAGSGVVIDFPGNVIACSTTGTVYYLETANTYANNIIAVDGGTGARTAFSGASAGSGPAMWSSAGAFRALHWDASISKLVVSDSGTSAANAGLIRVDVSGVTPGARAFYTGSGAGSGVAMGTPKFCVVASSGVAYYLDVISVPNKIIAVTAAGARSILAGSGTLADTAVFTNIANGGMGIVPTPPPVINSTLTASATYRTAASTYTITATNTPTSYAASNLPPGLSINTSTGAITGTPTSRAGSPYSVTITATNAGGTGSATLVYTINQKALTISGTVANASVYNGTTAASLTTTSSALVGVDAADTANVTLGTGSAAGTYADRNSGTAKAITVTGFSISGTAASSYSLTQPTGLTANVTAKPLTVSGVTAIATRLYNGTTVAGLTGTAAFLPTETAGTGTVSDGKPYAVDTIAIGGTAAGAFADRNVNTAKPITVTGITVTGTDAANYSVTQPTGLTANITTKALTVSGITATATRVYNGTLVAGLGGTAAFQASETAGTGTTSDGKPYSLDTIAIGGTPAGSFVTRNVGGSKSVTVSGVTVTGTDSANYSVTQQTGLTANVTQKPLTITGVTAVSTRVYNGTTAATLGGTAALLSTQTAGTGTAVDGKPFSVDSVTVGGTGAGTFSSRSVGTAKAVTVTGFVITGTGSGNYSATQPTGLTADVTAKPLTVAGVTSVATRVYDGTTVAGLSGTAAFLTTEPAGTGTVIDGQPYSLDSVSVTGTAAGAFVDRNVGTAKPITVTGLTVTGTGSTNYSVTQPTGLTGDVTVKSLTVSGLTAASGKVYDGTTAIGVSGTAALQTAETAGAGTTSDGVPYTVDTVSVTGTAAGVFSTRTVGTAKAVTISGLSLTGTDNANYALASVGSLTADITPKALTVAGLSGVATRVYDGTTVAGITGTAAFLTAEAAGTGTTSDGVPYDVDTITVGGTATGAFGTRTVGVAKTITVTGITVTGTNAANYTATQPTGLNGDITPKALTVAGLSGVATRVYDGTTVAGITGTAAFLTAETAGSGTTTDGVPYDVDTITVGGTAVGAFGTRTVGVAKTITVTGIAVSGANAANYTATQPTDLTGDITPKALTIAGLSAVATRVYDGTTVAGITGTAAFLTAEAAGTGTTSDGTPYTVDTISVSGTAAGAFGTKTIGTAKNITVTGLAVGGTHSANYTAIQPTDFTGDITKKALTVAGVTAVASRVYDGTAVAGLSGTAAFLSTEAAGAGTTVDGKPYSVDSVVVGGTAVGAFVDRTACANKPIIVSGLTVTGTGSVNYSVTQPAGLTGDVTPKDLTVAGLSAAVASRVYDGTTAIGITGTAALQSSETAGAGTTADGKPYSVDTITVTGTAAGAFTTRTVGTAKAITVSGLSLGGADNANYNLAAVGSLTADVTPKALTISDVTAVATRVYDGTTVAALTGTPGFAPAEAAGTGTASDGIPYTVDILDVAGTAAGAFADRNVGTAKAITVSGLTVAGTGASNYTATQPTGLSADVTAKALTVAGLSGVATRVYDGTTVAGITGTGAFLTAEAAGAGTTSDGVPYTVDTITVGGTAVGAFGTRTVGVAKTITVTGVTVSGTDAANYTATQPTDLNGDITPKALSIAGLSGVASRTYDGTTVAGITGTAAFLSAEAAGAGTTVDGKPYSVDTISVSGTAAGAFGTRTVGVAKTITVTGLGVGGTNSANYTAIQPTGLNGDITPKALTIAGVTAGDKIYDATTAATLGGTAALLSAEAAGAGTTVDGKPYSVDTISVGGTASGVFTDKDVAAGKTITVTGVTITGTNAANYTATQPAGLTAAVTKKTLTVSGVTAANKVYDGTTAASLSGTPALQSAEAPGAGTTVDGKPYTGDTFSAGGTLAGTFADKNVATGKTVAVAGVTLTGAQSGNYDLAALTTTADITAKALDIFGVAAVATRTYDGTTVAGLTGTAAFAAAEATGTGTTADGIPYTVDSVTVGGTAAGAFGTRTVGTAKTITVTGLTVSGTGASNYTATQPTGLTADVTAKALTVAGLTGVATRVYDGTTVAGITGTGAFLTAELAGSGTTSDGTPYTVDTITVGGTAAGAFGTRTVGVAKTITVTGVTVSGTDAANYTATQPTDLNGDITPKALSIAGLSGVASRTYDGTTVAGITGTAAFLSAEAAGAGTVVDGKPYTVDTISVSGTAAGAFGTRTVGVAKTITVTGLGVGGTNSANYTAVQPTGLNGDITPKALTIAGVTAADKIYDATTAATLGGTAAFLSAEAAGAGTTVDGKPYSVDTISVGGTAAGAFADKDVAAGKAVTVTGVTITGTNAANYSATQPLGVTAAVTKKTLTVSGVTAANKVYDGTTAASLSGTPALQSAEAPGAGTTVDGKPYTGDTFSAGGTLTGTFADKNVATGKTVAVAGVTLTGAQSGNYDVAALTTTADITAKALDIFGVAAVATRTYDGTTVAGLTGTAAFASAETTGTGTTTDGIPYSVDSVTVGGTAAGAFADRNVATTKAITVTGLTVSGTGAANYTATQPTGLSADITTKALNIAGVTAVATRIYDGTTVAGLAGTAAFLSSEAAGAGTTSDGKPYSVDTITVGGTAAGAFVDRNTGTAKAVTVTGLTVAGTDAANYTAAQPTGLTADVTAKALTVAGLSGVASRTYDGTTVAGITGTAAFLSAEAAGAGTTVDGKPYSVDTISVSGTAAGAFGTRTVGVAKTITVTGLGVGGTNSANYTAIQPTGLNGDIAPKALTIAGVTAADKIYDATVAATLGGTAAFLSAEAAGAGTTVDGKPYSVDTISVGGTAAGAFADKDVAAGKAVTVTGVTITGTNAANYSATQPLGVTAAVTKKTLTVSGVTAANKIYDGTTTASLSGTPALQSAEAPGAGTTADGKPYTGDTFSAGGTLTGAFADKNVATGKTVAVAGVTLSGAQSGNYDVAALTTTADITAKALNIFGVVAVATRIYDGTTVVGLTGTAALGAAEAAGAGTTLDGLPYTVDTISVGGAAAGAFADRNVGTAKGITVTGLTIAGTDAANYTATQPSGLTADVTAKALNIAGLSGVATRVYDGTTVAGITGTAAFLSTEAAGAGTTGDGKPYSVDTITVGGTAAGVFADRNVATAKAITVTGLTVGGTDGANYSATQPTGLTGDVTTKALTVAGLSGVASRTYDGTTVAGITGTAAFLSSEVAGAGTTGDGKPYSVDTISVSGTAAGAFADRNVATAKAITVTGLGVSGTDSGNYTAIQPTGLTGNVTAKALTIAGVTAADKIYDATTPAILGGTAAFLSSEAAGAGTTADGKPYSGDTITVGGTAAGAFADKDVATGKAVTVTGLAVAGTDAANYSATQPLGVTAAVTKKTLTVSGVTAANKIYDGTTAATLSGTPTLQGAEAPGAGTTADGKPYTGDTFTAGGTLTGTFADKDVATGKTVAVAGVTLSGAQSGNYAVAALTTTADITPKALDIFGVAAVAARTYDGTTVAGLTGAPVFAATEAAGTGTTADGVPYAVDSVTVGGTAAGAFADRNVGTAKAITVTGLTVTGTGAANYTATQPTGLTADVMAKALNIAGLSSVASRTYNGTTVAGLTGTAAFLSAEAAGAGTTVDGKPYNVDTITVGGTAAGAFADRNVGTTKAITVTGVTVSGTDAANYTATQPTGLTADVTAKALNIAGLSGVVSRTYDGTTVAGLTGTAAFLSAEAAGAGMTSDGKPYTVDTISVNGTAAGAFADRNVATAKPITVTGLGVSGTDNGNYTAIQPIGLTGNVTAKALTIAGVTAADKIYDATTPAVLGGTAAFLASEAAGAGTTVDGKPYSVDTITVGGTAAGVFADKDVASGKAVTVTGLVVAGTDSANYSATQPLGVTAAVTKKTLTVSGVTAANKIYDGTTAASLSGTPALQGAEAPGAGTTVDGKPYTGDTFTAGGTLTGTFADKDVATGKTVAVAGVTLSGAQSGNYDVAALTTTADITPKALNIFNVTPVATRIYDGTTVAGLTGVAAFAATEAAGTGTTADGVPYAVDSVTVGGTAAGAFANRNAGAAKAITVIGLTVSGTGAANYTATQPTGLTADITVKALNIAGVTAVATRIYDGTTVAGLGGTAAFLSSEAAGAGTTGDGKPYSVDTITVGGTAAGAFADRHVATAKAVTVTGLTVAGTDAGNYSATQPTGLTGDVTAKALNIAGLSGVASRTYDGTILAGLTGTAAFLSSEVAGAGTTGDGKPYSVDAISVTGTAAGIFVNRNVGTAKSITVTGLVVSGTDSGNYTAVQPTGLTGNVTAKALTIAGVTATDKIYDATTPAILGGTAAFLSSEAAGAGTTADGKPYSVDTIAVGGTATGAFADKDVATGKAVAVTGLIVTGTDAANYSATQPLGVTAAVTKKTLTVSGVTAANKIYDGTTAASLSGTPALQGAEAPGAGTTADGKPYTGDTFTAGGTLTGTFADKDVATGKTVAVAGVTLSGAQSGNYDVAALTTTADITPKALNIFNVTPVATRIYDGTTVAGLTGAPAFAATEAAGTGTTADGVPYAVDSVTIGGTAAGAFANRNVATAKAITVTGLTVSGTGAANYTATQPTGLTAGITVKALNIAGVTAAATRIYDGTTVAGLNGTAAFLASEAAGAGTTSDGKPYAVDTINVGGTAAGAFADRNTGTAKAITVTGLTVAGTDAGNYSATQPTGLTGDVTAKALNIAGLSGVVSRTYDGTTVAGLTGTAAFLSAEAAGAGTTSDGKPYSVDTISVTGTAAGVFANRTVGTGKGITVTGLVVSGTDSGNYTAIQPIGLTGNVTAKALTIAGVTAADKIYDATTPAVLGGTAAFLSAEAAGAGTTVDGKPYSVDTITVGGTAAGTFTDKDVAAGKAVTVTGLTVAGTDAANYSATQPLGVTAAVTKKTLTVSGVTAANKIYDGTTAASLSGTPALQGAEAPGAGTTADGKPYTGDTFTAGGTLTGTFADKDVATGKTVAVAGVTLSGAQSGNYAVAALTTTADITPKALNIFNVTPVATRIYDGTTVAGLTGAPAFAATEAAGTGTTTDGVPYAVDSVTVGGTAAGAFANRNVATAKAITVTGLTVSGAGAANYTATQPTGLTADITVKALNIAGLSAVATRVYDGTTVAGISGTAAFLSAEAAGAGTTADGKPYSVDTISVGGTAAGAFADRNTGTAKAITVTGLTVAGTDAGNYSATQPTGLTGDVTTKALNIAGLSGVASRTYDGTIIAGLTGTAAFLSTEAAGAGTTADGKPYSVDTISVTGTAAGIFVNRNVGTAKPITVTGLVVSGTDSGNYTAVQPTGLTGNVTAKALTIAGVTALDKIYDATTPATLGGTAAFLSSEAAGAGTTVDGKPYSVDTIAVGGTAAGAFVDKDVATGKAVTVTGLIVAGTDSANYSATQPLGVTAAVTKKTLTVSGITATNKIYDGTTAASLSGTPTLQSAEAPGAGTTADGKRYTGDTFGVGGLIIGTFADKNVATGKTVAVAGVTLNGAQSGNYAVAALTTTADITAKALNIFNVAAVATRIYDGTTVAGLTGVPAFAGTEAAGAGTTADGVPYEVDSVTVGGTAAGAFANRNAGTAKAITVTGLTVSGTGAANYTATQPTGLTADITVKALNIAGVTGVATRIYDGTTVAGLGGTAAFLASEAAGAGTTSDGKPYAVDTINVGGTAAGAFADRNTGTAKAVTVTGLTVAGTDAGNYSATQPTGLTADVTAKALNIAGLSGVVSRTYDGTTVAGLTGTAAFLSAEAAGAGTTSDGKPYSVDTISVTGTAAGIFVSRNVGTTKTITVTGLGVGGTDSGNYTAIQPTGLTGNVTAKALTIAGVTAADKIYDATTPAVLGGTAAFLSAEAAGAGTTVDGKPYSVDTITVGGTAAGTFTDKDVAAGKAVTVTGLIVTGIDAANYSATQPLGVTAAVTKKTLTVSGVTAANKIYDGTTAASLSGAPTLQSAEAPGAGTTADGKPYTGDTFTAGGTLTGTFADKDVATGKTVAVAGVTLSGAQSGNYDVAALTTTADITPKALNIFNVTPVATRIYDGTTVAGLTGVAAFAATEVAGTGTTADGVPYAVDSVTIGGTATGAFANRNAGTAKAITVTGLTVSGTGAANYTATQPTGLTADITVKALNIAGVTAVATRIYDGTTVAGLGGTAAFLSSEAAGAGTTSDGKPYLVDTITVGGTAVGAFADRHVNVAKAVTVTGLTVAGIDAGNYSATQPTGLTGDVTAKALNIAGLSGVASRTYDGTILAGLTGTAAFLSTEAAGAGTTVDGKPYSVDTFSLTGTAAGIFANRNVGTAKTITVTGLGVGGTDSGNYTAIQPAGLTGNVTAKALTIAGVTAADKIYDATTPAVLGGTAAFLSSESAGTGTTSDGKPYSVDTITVGGTASGAFADKDVATGKAVTVAGLIVAGADAANYSATQPLGLVAAVTKKTLTVSGVTAANKIYDGTTAATLSGTPTLQGAEAPGAGTTADGKPYTGDTFSAGGILVGTFADKNAATGKTVAVAGVALTGAQSGNYVVAALTATADITAKALNIFNVAAVATRIYDGTTVAGLTGTPALAATEAAGTGTTVDGVPYAVDSVTVGGTAAGAFANRNAGLAKAITVTGLTVSGTGAANYTATQPTGLVADVTAKALNVAGLSAVATRTYDTTVIAGLLGTPAFLTAEAAGAGTTVDGVPYTVDTITASGTPAGTFATKTVGTNKAITITGITVTGTDSANYSVTQPTGLAANVTTSGLTVAGITAANKIYDGNIVAALSPSSAALVGVLSGDTVTLSTSGAAGVFATKTVAPAKTVAISGLTISGTDASNYSLTQPTTTASITAKTITVGGITVASKVYDGNTVGAPAYGAAAFSGVVNGDSVTLVTTSGTATFSSKTVATGKTVAFAGLTLGSADAGNYVLSQPTATADITAKNLTVSGIIANNKTYDGTTVATLNTTAAALVGVVSGDATTPVTSGATGTFSDANVGINKPVQISGVGLAGADAGNYTLTQPSSSANITPAGVSIAITNLNFTYDGTPKSATVTITPAVPFSVVYSGGGSSGPTNAGSYTVTVNVSSSNYSGGSSAELVIAKASQTVAFSPITGANFNVGTTLSLNATASSGLPVTFAIQSGTASLSGSSVTITQPGAVSIRATQAGNENYLPASASQGFTGVAVVVTKLAQTINFGPLINVSVGVSSIGLNATASSNLPVSYTVISGPATVSGNNLVLSGAIGLVTVRASQAGNATYLAAPDVFRAFVVIPRIPDIFFGDLTDDSGIASRGELIGSSGPRLDAKNGDVAAAIFAGTNRGTVLIISPSLGLNVSVEFTVNPDGTYSAPFTSGGRSLTLTGTYGGGLLTGHIASLRVGFSTVVKSTSGSAAGLAGVYESNAVNSATGGTATIVSAGGQILVVANNGTVSAGATGTVNLDGTFNLAATGVTIAGTVDAPTTSVNGTITVAGQAPFGFASSSATANRTDRLINLSSRVRITPDRTLITGFVIGGTDSKRVLIRGVGPALTGFGVTGALTNPKLQLFNSASKLLLTNDDWSGADTSAAFAQVGAFALPDGSKDAALLTTLAPGAYTVQITAGTESGVALAEIYDASADAGAETQRLINISTRGTVDTGGDGLLIGGFVVTGNAPKRVLIRGVGPGLTAFGVGGALVDPRLALYSGSTLIAQNDDWSTPQPIDAQQSTASAAELSIAAQSVGAFALGANTKDAALIITLAPGAYTAQVSGAAGATGTAIVEIYELP